MAQALPPVPPHLMVQQMADNPDLEFLALQEVLVGRYSLIEELGRGGMGIVYLAHEVALDRPVALKILPPEYAAQPALKERFLREAKTAARLSHPNIVPIHAVDEVDDFVFFAMAYVEGETLGERVRGRGPLPSSQAARVLREMAWALAYGHAQGVVHRDVKPDNILLEAGSGRALLMDFGIAQVSDVQGTTGKNEVLGTAEFMIPEQAAGDPVDERSDLYSLAIVGHYVLSGKLPFQGDTVAATLAKQITQPAPPLASVAPEIPSNLAKAMDRCLAKDPTDRFADGEQLAEALSRSLEMKREIPVALRMFVEHNRERLRGLPVVAAFTIGYFFFSFYIIYEEGPLGLFLTALALIMGAAPVGMLVRMARELLRTGHSHQELLVALKTDIDARREEMAFELSAKKTWVDWVALGLMWGGLGVATLATGGLMLENFLGLSTSANIVLSLAVGGGSLAGIIGAPIAVTRSGKRSGVPGVRWLKFWKGRIGKAFFRAAGFRLKRVVSESIAHRPTEMAIGIAAGRLYDELPKEMQQSFSELPSVVRTLEEDAEKMRARVRELDNLIDSIEHDQALGSRSTPVGDDDVAERRASLAIDLQTARDGAQQRLTDAVSALETIRLELLRMHAGAGSVVSMTQDLSAAQALSVDIGHVLEGRQEVEKLLAGGRPGGRS